MFKLFHKKLNKKGFTLAELLIVVAIIAILVAIAIPIFMNSLAKAEKAAADANIRSVKAAAINTILEKWDDKVAPMGKLADGKTIPKYWDVEATVENGDVTVTKLQPVATPSYDGTNQVCDKTDKDDHYLYTIKLSIQDTSVNRVAAAS